jgi:hypothetical protein
VDTDTTIRLALLLLWVRGHVAAPFWKQWVQELPEEYTASGMAWSQGAISQLQWPVLQVRYTSLLCTSLSLHLNERAESAAVCGRMAYGSTAVCDMQCMCL